MVDGAELKAARKQLGLTQAALGTEVGADANTVARWERGETRVPVAVAKLFQLITSLPPRVSRAILTTARSLGRSAAISIRKYLKRVPLIYSGKSTHPSPRSEEDRIKDLMVQLLMKTDRRSRSLRQQERQQRQTFVAI